MFPPQKLPRLLWTITAVYWCIIFALTHTPGEHLPKVNINDKIEHLLAYGALSGLLFLSLWASRPQWNQIGIVALAIAMGYGAIDEWLQALPFVHRDCSLLDWFADTSGAAVAVVILTYLRRRISSAQAKGARQANDGSGTAPVTAAQISGPPDARAVEPRDA